MTFQGGPDGSVVTSPTIRKRILKPRGACLGVRRGAVTSPTIRKRILKPLNRACGLQFGQSYIAYDPQEDTETPPPPRPESRRRCGYIAYDPQEDTETAALGDACLQILGVTSPTIRKRILKPMTICRCVQDAGVTSPTIRKRILKPVRSATSTWASRLLHRLRSARGY